LDAAVQGDRRADGRSRGNLGGVVRAPVGGVPVLVGDGDRVTIRRGRGAVVAQDREGALRLAGRGEGDRVVGGERQGGRSEVLGVAVVVGYRDGVAIGRRT